jgi:hypothetical protein
MGRTSSQRPCKQNKWTVFLSEFTLTSGKEKGEVMSSARDKWSSLTDDKKEQYKAAAEILNKENGFK